MENKNITFDSIPQQMGMLNQKMDSIIKMLSNESTGAADQNDLLTVEQAAKFLSIARQTLYAKISRNEIPVLKPAGSKRVYFYKKDLIDYLNNGKQKTKAEYEVNATDCLTKKPKYNG
jgi:excisionase family DNA binding protein